MSDSEDNMRIRVASNDIADLPERFLVTDVGNGAITVDGGGPFYAGAHPIIVFRGTRYPEHSREPSTEGEVMVTTAFSGPRVVLESVSSLLDLLLTKEQSDQLTEVAAELYSQAMKSGQTSYIEDTVAKVGRGL